MWQFRCELKNFHGNIYRCITFRHRFCRQRRTFWRHWSQRHRHRYLAEREIINFFQEHSKLSRFPMVIVRTSWSCHTDSEQVQQLSEVDGRGSFVEHLIELLIGRESADRVEGCAKIIFADDTILIRVH